MKCQLFSFKARSMAYYNSTFYENDLWFLDLVLLNMHYYSTKVNPDVVCPLIAYFVTNATGTGPTVPAPFQLKWVANCISTCRGNHYIGLIDSALPLKLQSCCLKCNQSLCLKSIPCLPLENSRSFFSTLGLPYRTGYTMGPVRLEVEEIPVAIGNHSLGAGSEAITQL